MTSKGERLALPAGCEWGPTDRGSVLCDADGAVLAEATSGGYWATYDERGDATGNGGAADEDDARVAAEAALWARDGFGVGRVYGARLAMDVREALSYVVSRRPVALPGLGLTDLWVLTSAREVEGLTEIDAVLAPGALTRIAVGAHDPLGLGVGEHDAPGGEVPCSCGAWHREAVAEPAPCEPSAPTDGDELARLLPSLPGDIEHARSTIMRDWSAIRRERLARACELLLGERERAHSALHPYHAPTRDEGSYERTLARVLAELDRLRADDGARLRAIVAKNCELTDALGAAEEERDALRARYRETLLAFGEAAPDALRALRQRQHDATKPSPGLAEKIRAALRKKPAVKKEDGDVDE